MDYSHLACIIAILCLAGLVLSLIKHIARMQAQHLEQMQELLVLSKADTIDQFAAAADRLRRVRLEDARGLVNEGKVEPGVAERTKARRPSVWDRPPAPPSQPAAEE